jgi:radical SAM protein with 4Fe4S-binding SPASM domain
MANTRTFDLAAAALRRVSWPLAHWFSKLGGGSLVKSLTRLSRLRRTAGHMRTASVTPPLPVRLQIETTDICNFKCVMCTREIIDGMNTRSMSLGEFTKIVDEIDPYYVTMNGLGEPLIDKTLFEKLAYLHERNVMTSVPTNGTYIRREKLARLADNLPDILQMSIDGATKESFESVRKLSDFNAVIDNYRAICGLKADGKTRPGTSIRVLCAMQRANMYDFREMHRLFSGIRGADSFGAVPVFNYDAEGDAFAGLVPSVQEVEELHRQIDGAIAEAETEGERAFYRQWRAVSGSWLTPAGSNRVDPETNTRPCVIPWFNTYIDAKGRVFPCCYLSNSQHVMGNAYEQDFPAIWHGEKYQEFRRRLMTDRPHLSDCRTCPRNDEAVLRVIGKLGPLVAVSA